MGTGGGRRNLVPRSGAERREVGDESVRALEVRRTDRPLWFMVSSPERSVVHLGGLECLQR